VSGDRETLPGEALLDFLLVENDLCHGEPIRTLPQRERPTVLPDRDGVEDAPGAGGSPALLDRHLILEDVHQHGPRQQDVATVVGQWQSARVAHGQADPGVGTRPQGDHRKREVESRISERSAEQGG